MKRTYRKLNKLRNTYFKISHRLFNKTDNWGDCKVKLLSSRLDTAAKKLDHFMMNWNDQF